MILKASEITQEDLRHLHCTDRRLATEVITRSMKRSHRDNGGGTPNVKFLRRQRHAIQSFV